jgi:hypothetical protein
MKARQVNCLHSPSKPGHRAGLSHVQEVTVATIWLGNRDAIEIVQGEEGPERRTLPGNRCTRVEPHPGLTIPELIRDLSHHNGIWQAHSNADGPAWVASTDPDVAAAIAAVYGCPVRDAEPEA